MRWLRELAMQIYQSTISLRPALCPQLDLAEYGSGAYAIAVFYLPRGERRQRSEEAPKTVTPTKHLVTK
jgi:hypothetical protein